MQAFYTILGQFRSVRDKYINHYESTIWFLMCVLGILGWLILGLGLRFAFSGFLINGHFAFERLRGGLLLLIVLMFLFIEIIACIGIAYIKKRSVPACMIAIYAVFLFFLTAVPLLTEGTSLLQITRLNDDDIKFFCSSSTNDNDEILN